MKTNYLVLIRHISEANFKVLYACDTLEAAKKAVDSNHIKDERMGLNSFVYTIQPVDVYTEDSFTLTSE